MYTKRVQIFNYGPIDHFDIELPFEGDVPKPVLLVGENGSGKSIVLSHIVNGLILAQGATYPDTPEVEQGKVYKFRSGSYIKSGKEFYFAKVDFEDGLFVQEIRLAKAKKENENMLDGLPNEDAKNAWNQIPHGEPEHMSGVPEPGSEKKLEDIFSKNCILYFPPNRFEEPAWLNEENLKAKANYMELTHLRGYSDRKIINYSPLWDNQNWLFEVIFDQRSFELQTHEMDIPINNQPIRINRFAGYSGQATNIYQIALQIVRNVIGGNKNIRLGIGSRLDRVVSVMEGENRLVPNIFQLSSGETCLLNLFLSILRDFDLSRTPLTNANEVRGIVIVDEIDLHLHVVHQYEILPRLIKMFPRVQFVITTHSPLFVLGMRNLFGENGFALYRLPQGHKISPEEFGEFAKAYDTFSETRRFADDIREAIGSAQKPMVFVEGATDVKYIQKAAELLNQQEQLEKFELKDGGGSPNLDKFWRIAKLSGSLPQKIVLLYDCDKDFAKESEGNLFRRKIPFQETHPIKKGIENLFPQATLEKMENFKPAFIDIESESEVRKRGERIVIPKKWIVNPDEKSNLCKWLCENGTPDDFQHFQTVFSLLEESLAQPPVLQDEGE